MFLQLWVDGGSKGGGKGEGKPSPTAFGRKGSRDFDQGSTDSGFPWDPFGGHFVDFGLPYLLHGLRDGFFSGSGLEIMAGPDAWLCVKQNKYGCF